jgi:hypothetical protein
MNETNEEMLSLQKDLVEKRNLSESTAKLYIRTLYILNDRKVFKTLAFLKDVEAIKEKLSKYALSSQKTMLSLISVVVGLYADKPTYKKLHTVYDALMREKWDTINAAQSDKMNEKQKANWIEEPEIIKKREELKEKVDALPKKDLSEDQWDTLLSHLVLSLYTETEPRRNLDYLRMKIVKNYNDKLPKDSNYLSLKDKKFVFNIYKTAWKYGTQVVDVPPRLMDILKNYISYYPNIKTESEAPLLIKADKKPFTATNSITRILNKIFGKSIGSSALRHIILSEKYGDVVEDMKKTANNMAHSVAQQRDYIKVDATSKPKKRKLRKPESVMEVTLPTV